MKVFVTIYNPVDLFPPTINAIEQLSKKYYSVTLLTNSISEDRKWIFPRNVILKSIDKWPDSKVKKSFGSKITRYIKYVYKLRKLLTSEQYQLVVLYEPHAALAYQIVRNLFHIKPKILWYHNHDIFEMDKLPFYSLGWMAAKAEKNLLPQLSIFSLPSNERKVYFPMNSFRGKYFFIPNFPSKEFYCRFRKQNIPIESIRLIYQGRINEGHGLEQIISILNNQINGKRLMLVLKGFVTDLYKEKLLRKAEKNGTNSQIEFHGITSYKKVPEIASTCHIGIAIHTKTDVMTSTLGTSSNKIYEYAALGLPVLLYDNSHFREHLKNYKWAFFTNCSAESLGEQISTIINNYNKFSNDAYADFINHLNFEQKFTPVLAYLKNLNMKTGSFG